MKLSEALTQDRVRLGPAGNTLAEVAGALLRGLAPQAGIAEDRTAALGVELAEGQSGALIRANDDVLVAAIETPEADELIASLAVVPQGFAAPPVRDGDPTKARVLLLLASKLRVQSLRAEAFPRLSRAVRTGDATAKLLAAASTADVLAVTELMDTELLGTLRVVDALSPVSFRIYPDTPLPEVLDLMARRGVRTLPVVGTEYEVLGLISGGDALGQMVRRIGRDDDAVDADDSVLARDVMSRSVLCVEEEQTLLEAARLMVNKGFERLPVVRGGELVGFVTEETALRMLSSVVG